VMASTIASITTPTRRPAGQIVSQFLMLSPWHAPSRPSASRHLKETATGLALCFSETGCRGPRDACPAPNRWTVTHSIGLNARVRGLTTEQTPPPRHRVLTRHVSHLDGNHETLATLAAHGTPPDSVAVDCEEILIEEAAETGESDAQKRTEAREMEQSAWLNWSQHHPTGRYAWCQRSGMRTQCKSMILCRYNYFCAPHHRFLLQIRILCGAILR
jgi:hypothetical protein